jgi:hypothetical protein
MVDLDQFALKHSVQRRHLKSSSAKHLEIYQKIVNFALELGMASY